MWQGIGMCRVGVAWQLGLACRVEVAWWGLAHCVEATWQGLGMCWVGVADGVGASGGWALHATLRQRGGSAESWCAMLGQRGGLAVAGQDGGGFMFSRVLHTVLGRQDKDDQKGNFIEVHL
ncbi:hypothetical protein EDB89DRAFT_1912545 [Lactarius sanguifluus]|nr:hypothetical protein EDB89DRAFT_1912545 [Lactarius sanguifluus]